MNGKQLECIKERSDNDNDSTCSSSCDDSSCDSDSDELDFCHLAEYEIMKMCDEYLNKAPAEIRRKDPIQIHSSILTSSIKSTSSPIKKKLTEDYNMMEIKGEISMTEFDMDEILSKFGGKRNIQIGWS